VLRAYILFDSDGVIIDSEPLHEKAYRQTSLHLGRDLTQEEVASLKGTVDALLTEMGRPKRSSDPAQPSPAIS